MKCRRYIQILVLGILTGMPSIVWCKVKSDSLLLDRIFNYQRNFTQDMAGYETNVYMKFRYHISKRNATLWLIPTMYPLAKGDHDFILETYNHVRFNSVNKYDIHQQLEWGTIPHNRKAMSPILDFLTPKFYDACIYQDHTLSPFHRSNRRYYKYTVGEAVNGRVQVSFSPRIKRNTQLLHGIAYVDQPTGRIIQVILKGDYDGIAFNTEAIMGDEGARSNTLKRCYTNVDFSFSGNRIGVTFEAAYDCPRTLPDSIRNQHDRALLDSLRPIPLSAEEREIYRQYDSAHAPRPESYADSAKHHNRQLRKAVDVIGENLVTSIRYRAGNAHFRLFPIISPQYLSYSHRYGVAYMMKFNSDYHFNAHRYFEFKPRFGYNFKFKKFYFTLPLRFNYNPKRDGYVELIYGNGNRTGHSSVVNDIQREHQDTLHLDGSNLNLFDDNHLRVTNNIMVFDWLDVETGLVFHQRKAYNASLMHQFNRPSEYRSLAPMLSFKVKPWSHGPLFSIDYERGLKQVNASGLKQADKQIHYGNYERWEVDCSMKYLLHPMKKVNIRLGGGLYTRRKDNFFVDYENFRDNNLPEGWDDDWTGNFQLLNSRWYNESKYYARANFSYDSPLMAMSHIPVLGRYVEKERVYLSALSIDKTRPYSEVGYGFSSRFFSIGLFSSFLNAEFQEIECKFTFELFRRW